MPEHNPAPDPRDQAPGDVPFDAANQSLADALRASFRVLRAIMILLVIVFLFTGVKIIDNSEEAVVLRLGKLLPKVGPGLSFAFPYPIDETLVVPTFERTKLDVRSHWFHVNKGDETKSLRRQAGSMGDGLHPTRDGALLTADRGLIHVKWTVFYRIEDLEKYVRNVADGVAGDTEELITSLLENAAVRHAVTFTAEEITRTKTADLGAIVKSDVNKMLGETGLSTGIVVESLETEAIVPLQTQEAFDNVTRADHKREELERQAQKRANDILNRAAGESHTRLLALLDKLDEAKASGESATVEELNAEVERMLEENVAGMAGAIISGSRSFYTQVIQQTEGDVEEYDKAMAEYLVHPDLLVNRLWEGTRRRLLRQIGIKKIFAPAGAKEIRVIVYPDPKEKEFAELEQLRKKMEGGDVDEEDMGMLMPVEVMGPGRIR